MTTVILTTAMAFGQTMVQNFGHLAVNYAQGAIANAFDNRLHEGPRLESFHVQSSDDGAPMARVFGKARIAGQVIWASRIKEHVTEESVGSKGGPSTRNYRYSISFAVGLSEGEILDIGAIWANGNILATKNINMRLYKGTQTQSADPLLAEIEKVDVPAFRGCAYIVFEDFPLDDFGARLPQLNFEIIRICSPKNQEPRLEDLIQAVDLIPATGEFAYNTQIIEDRLSVGNTRPINMNNFNQIADLEASLDQLQNQLPHCRSVNLIVSWFGDDLRLSHCQIRPGVERSERDTIPKDWQVGGEGRENAYQITDQNGRVVYGGTPDDGGIVEAIQSLKSRGFEISILPFLLMDIPDNNTKPNPYDPNQNGQATFPWRGRITCDPAPNVTGSVDKTSAATTQVQAFFGTAQNADFTVHEYSVSFDGGSDYSYRRFILHYAHLAKLAGGVDRFLIGSEMVGLSRIRGAMVNGEASFPAVEALKTLASDVRDVLGANCQLSYAADWSEYFGYHPFDGSGDVFFNLDPLWADPNIDAVGIDAYFPLSDWRDTSDHLDLQICDQIYDLDYLRDNVQGGEGYDWYYASAQDRVDQNRSPITDGQGKPWIYRYKDLSNWWGREHFNRPSGMEQSVPTPWQPRSKPIWFCEIGCPAIDKGANQPNVFWDPKSSESAAPYFSSTGRDDLIQRAYLSAFLSYWREPQNNPLSDQYGGRMIDLGKTHVWCWDARPYPDFPARSNIWADGQNWQRGHWLNGRCGLVGLGDVIWEICQYTQTNANFKIDIDVSNVHGVVSGFVLERPMTARQALGPLCSFYGVDTIETIEGIRFQTKNRSEALILSEAEWIKHEDGPAVQIQYPDQQNQPQDIRVRFIDPSRSYQVGSARARDLFSQSNAVMDINIPLVLDASGAKIMAQNILARLDEERQELSLNLGANWIGLEIGDVIRLSASQYEALGFVPTNLADIRWKITHITGTHPLRIKAKSVGVTQTPLLVAAQVGTGIIPSWPSKPEVQILDLPDFIGADTDQNLNTAQAAQSRVLVGGQVSPWTSIGFKGPHGDERQTKAPIAWGCLQTEFVRGPIGRCLITNPIDAYLPNIVLADISDEELLSGKNQFAVQTSRGWEIFQAQFCQMVAQNVYRINGLVRGQYGSNADMDDIVSHGANLTYLDQGWADMPVRSDWIEQQYHIEFSTIGREDIQSKTQIYKGRSLRPYSPVFLRYALQEQNVNFSWIRRSRTSNDVWGRGDIVLGEQAEQYQISFLQNGVVQTSMISQEPHLSLNFPTLEGIFGSLPTDFEVQVQQISQTYGPGAASRLNVIL